MEGRPLEAVGGRETGSGASLFTALEEECWWQGPFSPPGEALCRSLWATERSRDSAAVSSATQEPCLAGTLPCCYSNEFRPAACPMSLPELVRKRLSSFSQTVFTDNNRTGPEDRGGDGIPDNKIVSNLPLQMSLYFNLCFFPFWWLSSVVVLQLKYSFLPDYYKFILVTVIILSTLIEIIRLYLGYMGNLQEKVITAFLALKRMVNQLATRFHLHEFDRLDEQLPSDHLAWKQRRMDAPWVVRPPVEEIRSTSVGWGSAVRA
ncbi:transmembrane protein 17 isoform X2 [Hemicordylus capensis]|uniref:transmembrane protein 17 isoform X2 n=1 Tax=Hemicordylus capensis TaxID=884348 RepID=UPI002302031D|nr:transmembrane protein 17 isoform X2 [Hemicordylus capensis]